MSAVEAPPGLVVIGASLAGLRAVEAAREVGYAGSITMIGAEPHIPYDRPPLSKAFISDPELDITLRDAQSLREELDVTLLLGEPATALDTAARTVRAGGRDIPYASAVIATGAAARRLPLGEGLSGVHTLRTLDDSSAVRKALRSAKNVVVVGAGFIGSEIASVAAMNGAQVTIVELAPIPLARVIGDSLGEAMAQLHARHGTALRCGVSVSEVQGAQAVERVVLSDGTTLPADLVVIGAGAVPSTDWLAGSGLDIDNGIVCDETLCAGAPDVYAAGDVARWPNPQFARSMRVEHWTTAAEQGSHAGRAAVDPASRVPFSTVPYFWSDIYDSRVQGLGLTTGEMTVLEGSLEDGRFLAGFREGDSLVGVFTLDMPHRTMKYRRFIGLTESWDAAAAFADAAMRKAQAAAVAATAG